jgi:protein-L-isoaspartate O-methyltransferase
MLLFFIIPVGILFGILLLRFSMFLVKKNHVLYGPVFIPTKDTDVATMIAMANLQKKDRVADLGSGDGKVVIAVAQEAIKVDGYESGPYLAFASRLRIHRLGLEKKAKIHWQDFWNLDFSCYDVLMMYTSQFTMDKLEKKIYDQLKPGARVVSNTFEFPNWKAEKRKGKIVVYKK